MKNSYGKEKECSRASYDRGVGERKKNKIQRSVESDTGYTREMLGP
jgi:hypothetical protein